MKILFYFLFFSILITSCTGRKNITGKTNQSSHSRILVLCNNSLLEEQLQKTETSAKWIIAELPVKNYVVEDSLKNYHLLLLPFSTLHQLDHRNLTTLKRFMEAGGGVIAFKDTASVPFGWPWLADWQNFSINQEVKQNSNKLLVLPNANLTQEEEQKAVDFITKENQLPDFSRATTLTVPDSSRYTYQVLNQGINEPMQMAILPGNNVLFVERKGAVKLFDATTQQTKTIANIDVFSGIEDGLLGVAADPGYARNNWVYFYYAVPGNKAVNRLARMELRQDFLDRSTEKVLLEIPTQRKYCCHSAGYLQFGPDGLLYLSTGDNTNAEETEGYIPIDERPGRQLADDQATAANTNDLRGKILRIKPEPDGTYSIPDGNLFPKGTPKTRPEIYTMGHRNPYRFSIDPKNNFVYWGDIGPDTKVPASEGTLSYDEINQARKPGFFGWPYFLGNNEVFPYYD
ncbi:MAG: PQQ-dependent sugar dehydrogenase [Bacteroidota bacterium]|nr:PQQ-dependent sugar dehydrogenase [Bacteroidota bacterium]